MKKAPKNIHDNVIDKFKTLPEANVVPRCVRDAQDTINAIADLDLHRIELCKRLVTQVDEMQHHLLKLWNRSELESSGLITIE